MGGAILLLLLSGGAGASQPATRPASSVLAHSPLGTWALAVGLSEEAIIAPVTELVALERLSHVTAPSRTDQALAAQRVSQFVAPER